MRRIAVTDIEGYAIGQVEDAQAATGATVIIAPSGMAAGLDVRGGGPASRDSRVLDPLAAADTIHAVLLAGGSAFGLDAAGGVQRYLEERGIGLEVGPVRVPLVCQSDIFDLLVGSGEVRPDAAMGYAACVAAEAGNYRDGNYGVGCGATVGKALGTEYCMKSGIGSYAVQVGDLKVGAVMVVNALGGVYDPVTGRAVAGLLAEDKRSLRSSTEVLAGLYEAQQAGAAVGAAGNTAGADAAMAANTTIGVVLTNAGLAKAQLCKVAGMAHDGMARAVRPVHTSMDGDSIYALSAGDVKASTDLVGILAAEVVAQAILVAACSAAPAYGLPSAAQLPDSN